MKVLHKLIQAVGLSGQEDAVRKIIMKEMKGCVDTMKVDKFGNLICHKKGKAPRVMLAAHMDEIGLIVRKIKENGRIRVSSIGGIDPLALLNQNVLIHSSKKPINGVVTTPEMSDAFEIEELPTISELLVDTGLSKKELTKKGVKVGDYVSLNSASGTLGSEDILFGKALDDRIGCFILIEAAKKLKRAKSDIFYVFTVQEEVGLYGSKTSAYQIEPDWAIAIDVTNADDMRAEPTKKLGGGPCVTVKDSDMIANKCLNDWLFSVAKKKKINVQREVSDFGTTDAFSISISRGGVPSSVLGVPVRNLHSAIGVVHKKDITEAINLIVTLMKHPPRKCIV